MKIKDKRLEMEIAEMKKFKQEVTSSKEKSRNLLYKAGIITKKGNLKKQYK